MRFRSQLNSASAATFLFATLVSQLLCLRHASSRSRITTITHYQSSCFWDAVYAASLALATGFALPSFAQDVDPEQIATTHRQMTATRFKPVHAAEGRSQAKCEGVPNRIFVMTAAGSECIAYFVTRGFEARREAVLFFGGDAISADETWQQENLEAIEGCCKSRGRPIQGPLRLRLARRASRGHLATMPSGVSPRRRSS